MSYYRKRPSLLPRVAAGLVAGSALRQIARSLGCAPNTVAGIGAHLGRHAMLLQTRILRARHGRLAEPIVFDHFETFEYTQDYPFGVATAVGARSWFIYGLDPAPHARTGRRSPAQRRRLTTQPPRSLRGCHRGSTRRMLDLLLELRPAGRPLVLRTDAHPEYVVAVRQHAQARWIRMQRFPNPPRTPRGEPPSPQATARNRAMFPVDLLHKLLRHSMAHHRRETIAFARRLNAAMERLFLTTIWRNLVKRRSERRSDSPTPAMMLGLARAPWSWNTVLSRRLFHDRLDLPRPWRGLYRREWLTPLVVPNARHQNVRAF